MTDHIEAIKRNHRRRHAHGQRVRCPECGAFVNESQRHQACKECAHAVFVLNGQVVDREARPGTSV